MMKRIVIASGKGGVGKSTAAVEIGKALAKTKRVLLIDCDPGINTLSVLLDRTDAVFSWADVAAGRCEGKEAVIRTEERLDLLPAPNSRPDRAERDIIAKAVSDLQADYDCMIFDAPAGLGEGLLRAAAGAELAVILATADDVSVRGAGKAAELLADNGLKDCRLLLNRYSVKAAKKGRLLTVDEAMERTFLRLLGVVPEDKTIGPAWEQKPNSPARQAFRRVADRLDGKNVPFLLSKIK